MLLDGQNFQQKDSVMFLLGLIRSYSLWGYKTSLNNSSWTPVSLMKDNYKPQTSFMNQQIMRKFD